MMQNYSAKRIKTSMKRAKTEASPDVNCLNNLKQKHVVVQDHKIDLSLPNLSKHSPTQ